MFSIIQSHNRVSSTDLEQLRHWLRGEAGVEVLKRWLERMYGEN